MAQYTITYECGHTGVVNLFGPHMERDKKIAWLQTQECPECKKSRILEKVSEITRSKNLPSLSGSEKQISWAEEIRAFFINYYDEFAPSVDTSKPELLNIIRDWLISVTESEFWIDNRGYFNTDGYVNDDDKGKILLFKYRLAEIYQLWKKNRELDCPL